DFHARYAAAYAGELDGFLRRVRDGRPGEPGLDIGWKTVLVAELAEQSSREGGRLLRLVMADGSPPRSAADALTLVQDAGSAPAGPPPLR
nr:hypothetical protein [Burkholderiales bacterium]